MSATHDFQRATPLFFLFFFLSRAAHAPAAPQDDRVAVRVSPWFAHGWASRHRPRAPHQRSFKPADVYVRGAIHPLLVSLVLLRTGVRILHYDLRGAERAPDVSLTWPVDPAGWQAQGPGQRQRFHLNCHRLRAPNLHQERG